MEDETKGMTALAAGMLMAAYFLLLYAGSG